MLLAENLFQLLYHYTPKALFSDVLRRLHYRTEVRLSANARVGEGAHDSLTCPWTKSIEAKLSTRYLLPAHMMWPDMLLRPLCIP